jgi:6-phosphogluconolactonase
MAIALEVLPTAALAAEAAARRFTLAATAAIESRGRFVVALSGGSTPRAMYAQLATASLASTLDWSRVEVLWGDERCVPPDHEASNYRMAREALFEPYAVPEKSILRMRGEIEPALAAQEYEDALALLATQHGETIYRHDLMLLGMGDDGHTASLFPGTEALSEQVRRVAANYVPKLGAWRLTMTLPLLNQSRHVLFLVSGDKNPELLEQVLAGGSEYPAARINPPNGQLTWMIGERA